MHTPTHARRDAGGGRGSGRSSRARWHLVALLAALALVAAACSGAEETTDETTPADSTEDTGAAEATEAEGDDAAADDVAAGGGECEQLTPVRLQLKWVAQAQFAGYYAADELGYYEDRCLEMTILEGGPDIGPAQVVAGDSADFGVDWVAATLAQRAAGEEFVNIAQIFERSGMLQVAWADSGISDFADLEGRTVGAWGFGNEYELLAALQQAGLDPETDLTLVDQPFDVSLLLNREADAIQAITYNEYAQILETTNPETGELYQPEDLVTLDMNDYDVNMLHDGLFAKQSYVEENPEVTQAFVEASLEGWMFCRDNPEDCVQIVFDRGSILGQGHQRWMMNEVNKLIWPSTNGIGMMDPEAFQRTAEIAETYIDTITETPTDEAYTTEFVEAAHSALDGDVMGSDYTPQDVEVTPGGE